MVENCARKPQNHDRNRGFLLIYSNCVALLVPLSANDLENRLGLITKHSINIPQVFYGTSGPLGLRTVLENLKIATKIDDF